MAYVDSFLLAVPDAQREACLALAGIVAEVFRDHGTLRLGECRGDDVPEGVVTSFPMAVKPQPGETVVFSSVGWPSRAARDAGHRKPVEDPRLAADGDAMPVDGKRMIFGGFVPILDR